MWSVVRVERDFRQMLASAGLRVTLPRLTVLAALTELPHSTPAMVDQWVRRRCPGVSVQTIYDVLAALVDGGLARKVELGASPAVYELRVGDNHHHLVCRHCGAVEDVECAGVAPCLQVKDSFGYRVDEADVVYRGLCPDCLTNDLVADEVS